MRSCRQASVFSLHSSFLLCKERFGFSYRWFDISPTATAFVSSSIAMLNCLAHLSSDLCSICGCATTLCSYQLPLPKIVLNRDCKMQKKVKSKVAGRHQHSQWNPALCYVWEARLFWLLIVHFMANGICFKFNVSFHAVMVLLVLEATLVLQIAQVVLVIWLTLAQISAPKLAVQELQLWVSYHLPWAKKWS